LLKNIAHTLKTEPWYLICENIFRKLLQLEPVNKEKTVAHKTLIIFKKHFIRSTKILYQSILFYQNKINISLVFTCHKSQLTPEWLAQITKLKYSWIKIIFLSAQDDKLNFTNNIQHHSKTNYYIIFDRPAIFIDFGLYDILVFLKNNIDTKLFYTDHWQLTTAKKKHFCKPSFNEDYYLAYNYVQLPLIIHSETLKKLIQHPEFDINEISWIYNLLLLALEFNIPVNRLESLSTITIPYTKQELDTINESRKVAINVYLNRKNIEAKIEQVTEDVLYINRTLKTNKKVAIIIPFKDKPELLKSCVLSIIQNTKYTNYELLLISNNSKEERTFALIEQMKAEFSDVKIYFFEHNIPFNYSALNNWAAKQTDAEYILFLNNDTEVLQSGWLTNMYKHIQRENVAAVGALLLYPDFTVQHGGVIIGIGDFAGHAHRNFDSKSTGYMNRLISEQEISAVTGACLLTLSNLFRELGGFNEISLAISNNDVDYCLRVKELGYYSIYTPHAKLYHYESKSRQSDLAENNLTRYSKELFYMKKRHEFTDPYYNKNLTKSTENFKLPA